jgi:hypothetical protein
MNYNVHYFVLYILFFILINELGEMAFKIIYLYLYCHVYGAALLVIGETRWSSHAVDFSSRWLLLTWLSPSWPSPWQRSSSSCERPSRERGRERNGPPSSAAEHRGSPWRNAANILAIHGSASRCAASSF